MNKLEQAARQALEVLKNQSPDRDMVRAAFALQEALAEQAEQEPVAIDWEPLQKFWRNNSGVDWEELESAVKCAVAAHVRTKDLTDDEIAAICADLPFDENFDVTVARAVIAADREKNK